jgi:hypothetical protein
MRSISRRKWIFSAGLREALKGDFEKSTLEAPFNTGFVEVSGTTFEALFAPLAGAFFRGRGFLETGALALLGAAFVIGFAWDFGFIFSLETTGRRAFLGALFLDWEVLESLRAMS